MPALQFHLQHTDKSSQARAGKIVTDHGEIETPIFMPVGTAGSVKAVTQQQLLEDIRHKPDIIFLNDIRCAQAGLYKIICFFHYYQLQQLLP